MDESALQSELRVVPFLDPDDFKLRSTDLKFVKKKLSLETGSRGRR